MKRKRKLTRNIHCPTCALIFTTCWHLELLAPPKEEPAEPVPLVIAK